MSSYLSICVFVMFAIKHVLFYRNKIFVVVKKHLNGNIEALYYTRLLHDQRNICL